MAADKDAPETLTVGELDQVLRAIDHTLNHGREPTLPEERKRLVRAREKLSALRPKNLPKPEPKVFDSTLALCTCGHSLANHDTHHKKHPCLMGLGSDFTPLCDCNRYTPRGA